MALTFSNRSVSTLKLTWALSAGIVLGLGDFFFAAMIILYAYKGINKAE